MNSGITILTVDDADLDSENISNVTRLFDPIVVSPKNAKKLRGSIVFEFGRFDKDPRPNFIIPAVRKYVQLIDNNYPYFMYFLPESSKFQQISFWILSLAAPTDPSPNNVDGIMVNPGELLELVLARIQSIQDFCDRILDDSSDIVNAIYVSLRQQLPSELMAEFDAAFTASGSS
jgi:hypothetical protein